MKQKAFRTIAILSMFLMLGPSWVKAKTGEPKHRLPSSAVRISDDVYYLGSRHDPQSGKMVSGYAFVKFKNGAVRERNVRPGGGPTTCYSYLSRGAMWKTVEPWLMNPANTRGLNTATLFNLETGGIAKWEDATDGVVGNGSGADVIGNGTSTNSVLAADSSSPDGKNEVYFADVASPGAIAVTIVWGIFSGPSIGRELVEWDQVYDDVDFDWSAQAAGVSGKMDLDNIATHELGHTVGLGHPSNTCTEETMYAYADYGETKKRDLNTGDINGMNKLY